VGRARFSCRDARDLSWTPEIRICVAGSPAACPSQSVHRSAREVTSEGQRAEPQSSTWGSTSETRRAVSMRRITFVRQLLYQPEGATIARCVARCRPLEYRVWVKATAYWYPVQSCLHRCGVVQSPHCPYCQGQDETLAHFTTICPRFRDTRTAGHNRVRAKLTSLLAKCLNTQWQLFQEIPMRRTPVGLELQTVSAACMVAAGRLSQGHHCKSATSSMWELATGPGAGVAIS
jgi:hypothetical protein